MAENPSQWIATGSTLKEGPSQYSPPCSSRIKVGSFLPIPGIEVKCSVSVPGARYQMGPSRSCHSWCMIR